MWDVGGQERIRALWRHYYHGSDAIIFMVDSCDAGRLPEARYYLRSLFSLPVLSVVCFNQLDGVHQSNSVPGVALMMRMACITEMAGMKRVMGISRTAGTERMLR